MGFEIKNHELDQYGAEPRYSTQGRLAVPSLWLGDQPPHLTLTIQAQEIS